METPEPTDKPAARSGWKEFIRRPATRITLLAIVIILAQWIDARQRTSELQQELARRLSEGDAVAKEGRAIARQGQEALAALQAKVGVLEARLAETQSQAVALEAMYQELSSTRDERLLAEVE